MCHIGETFIIIERANTPSGGTLQHHITEELSHHTMCFAQGTMKGALPGGAWHPAQAVAAADTCDLKYVLAQQVRGKEARSIFEVACSWIAIRCTNRRSVWGQVAFRVYVHVPTGVLAEVHPDRPPRVRRGCLALSSLLLRGCAGMVHG